MNDKPKFLIVREDTNFVRDTSTNAILANNIKDKKAFIENQKREHNISKISEMNNRIEKLENNIDQIKTMLESLINNSRTS